MLLKCKECGNTQTFTAYPEQCLFFTVQDEEIVLSGDDIAVQTYLPLHAVFCEECGSWGVEMAEDFREKFWATYERLLKKE